MSLYGWRFHASSRQQHVGISRLFLFFLLLLSLNNHFELNLSFDRYIPPVDEVVSFDSKIKPVKLTDRDGSLKDYVPQRLWQCIWPPVCFVWIRVSAPYCVFLHEPAGTIKPEGVFGTKLQKTKYETGKYWEYRSTHKRLRSLVYSFFLLLSQQTQKLSQNEKESTVSPKDNIYIYIYVLFVLGDNQVFGYRACASC